jgi:hypothetical protein
MKRGRDTFKIGNGLNDRCHLFIQEGHYNFNKKKLYILVSPSVYSNECFEESLP